jgi:hypothetical protein
MSTYLVEWTNRLRRALEYLDENRWKRAEDPAVYDAYMVASVELTPLLRDQRERLSRACAPWFTVPS